MGAEQIAVRLRHLACPIGELADIGVDRPLREGECNERARRRHRRGSGVTAPGDGQSRRDKENERQQRERIVAACDHQERGAEQIGGERSRRSGVDAPRSGVGPEEEAGDD
jgi:hypothetical protein